LPAIHFQEMLYPSNLLGRPAMAQFAIKIQRCVTNTCLKARDLQANR
jgi:hypothetical protein